MEPNNAMLERLDAILRQEEALAKANKDSLAAAHVGLTPDQSVMLIAHLVGALTRLVHPDDFAVAVEDAREFAVAS